MEEPQTGESKDKYMARVMNTAETKQAFPNGEARRAAVEDAWNRSLLSADMESEPEPLTLDDMMPDEGDETDETDQGEGGRNS